MKYRHFFVVVLGAVLLVLAGCSGVASTPAALAQTVQVSLSDQQISADRSTFSPGQPYHFVVTNKGNVAHQFMMTPRGWDYDHMSMDQRHHVALYMYDQVAPGETRTFDYTFPASAVGQSYGFACYQQGSDMWYPFSVQQPSTTTAPSQVVHVSLSDQQISADRSTFDAGMTYHFVVTNKGNVAHQFMMAPGGWDYDHMSMGQRHQRALYMYDQVAPGETRTFDYTFPASAVEQSYGFACYQQGSDMWYPFTVQHPSTTTAPYNHWGPGENHNAPGPTSSHGTPGMGRGTPWPWNDNGTPEPGMSDRYHGMSGH